MNLEHIAQFIELVSNPTLYSEKLKELASREEAIKSAMDFSGSVSELEKLKAKYEKLISKAETALASAEEKATAIVDAASKAANEQSLLLAQKLADVDIKSGQIDTLAANAAQQLLEVNTSKKDLRVKEESLQAWELRVIEKEKELDERLAKLRSVMG